MCGDEFPVHTTSWFTKFNAKVTWWSIQYILIVPDQGDTVLNVIFTSYKHPKQLTLRPPNKLSSVKFLVCFNFQSASMLLKVGENVVSSKSKLFAYGSTVVLGGLY